MEKFKNIDGIIGKLEEPINKLYNNLEEGHAGGCMLIMMDIKDELRHLKSEVERLKKIES